MRKINLGLIGLGTIGEGVYKLLKSQKNRIKKIYDIDIDLVKYQIMIAAGYKLELNSILKKNHTIECRINAENAKDF